MTVSTTESQIDYTGNGATVFAIPFLFLANGDLVLTKMDANDAVTTLVLGSDYTLSGAGNPSGGAATLTAPLTTGNRLRIARSMIAVQETDLRNQGKFYQQTIEDAFDYVTLLIQQYRTAIANSMQKSIGGLFWDALGLVIRNVGAPVKANDATTKSYVDTNIANTGSASIAYTDAAIAKTVRAPENLAPLAAAGTRANRLMGFDSLGNPVAVVPGSGPVNDASAVLWSRSPLDQAIASVHQGLDASDISPWEYAGLVTSRPTPSDPRTWDWTPAIQAAINEAWGYSPGGAVFNNAISASMRSVNLGGMTYGIGSTVSLPSGGGSGGAGGAFRICNGGLVALAGFAAGTAMLRASSLDANDWTQNVYIENIEFDGARNADRCIEVQKSVGTYIDKCHITRYNDRGVTTSNSAFNVLVTRCYIEAFPFGTGTEATQRAQAPEAGIYFNSADCAAFNNTIIGNIRGIRVANRSRIAGNHLYGNKYAIDVALQYATVVGNYLEDPIITSVSFADCAIEANFFSDSIRGGCLLSPDDGAGQLRGANIGDNPFSRRTLTATGNLTLSGTSGLITITSSAADFDNFVTTGHCPDGAVIAAGGAYAVVIDDASNSTTSVKARAVGTFSGTSFATGSWTQNVSFIALIETTFGASSALNVSGSANIRHTGTSVNQSTTTRSFFNNGGTIGIPSRSLYDWGQGDGRGDFWVGNTSPTTPQGLAFGVLTTSANAGSAAIWSYGTLEQVAVGGRTAGQYALFTATDLRPGADNTRSCGTSSRRWSTVYAGTGTINTSDAREKTDVRVMADAEIAAAKQLASEIGVYQFLDSVRAKGADARSHVGMTVQRAIEVMESHGLNPFGYGFICYDSWPDREAILDDDGSVIDPAQIAGDRYSFRDNELAYFILSGLQARQADLEERLTSLESK